MSQSASVVKTLKRLLAQKELTYAVVAERLAMSEAGVKKMFSKEKFSLERLEQICDVLGVTFQDLFVSTQSVELARRLNKEQEEALAVDEQLYVIFQHVLKGFNGPKLQKKFVFTAAEIFRILRRLDGLGLIELHPGGNIRLRVAKHVSWIKDGPLHSRYRDALLSQFIGSKFAASEEFLDFLAIQAPPSTLQIVEAKLKKMVREIRELAELNPSPGDSRNTWILLGMRGAEFNVYKKYLRKRPGTPSTPKTQR